MKKLSNRGFSHLLVPVLAFLMVAGIGGAYMLATSHAAPAQTSNLSTSTSTTTSAADIDNVHICNSYGNKYCVGAPSLGSGDAVKLTTDGRTLNLLDQDGLGHYKLQFDADHTKCVGASSIGNLTVRDCSNSSAYVVWLRQNDNNGHWLYFDNQYGAGQAMTSRNALNSQLFLCDYPCPLSGTYQAWNR